MADRVLGAIRVLAALSLLLALAVHTWLMPAGSPLHWATPAALVIGLVAGRLAHVAALAAALVTCHAWPTIVWAATGSWDVNAFVLWEAGLIGIVLGGAAWNRWHMPSRWQPAVAAWAAIVALGWPLIAARESDFTVISLAQLDTFSSVSGGPPWSAAAAVGWTSLAQLSAILFFDSLWARFRSGGWARFFPEVVAPLALGALLAIGVGILQGLVDLGWLSPPPWPALGRATGTLGDGNAFGAVAAWWMATVAGTWCVERRGRAAWGGALVLLAAGLAVWLSGSRTALMAYAVVAAATAIACARRSAPSTRTVVAAGLVVVALLGVGSRLGGAGTAASRLWRTLPSPTVASVEAFATSMWVRDGYGLAANMMVREHPLAGVGPGTFPIIAPDYFFTVTGRVIPPDNAQNVWRHLVAELGVLGSVPAFVCSALAILTIAALFRGRWGSSTIVGAGMLALGLISLVGEPTSHPLILHTAVVLLFWGTRLEADAGDPATARPVSFVPTVALAVLLPLAWVAASSLAAAEDLRPPVRALRAGWQYWYGFSAPEPVAGGERRWASRQAVGVIPVPVGVQRLLLTLDRPLTAHPMATRLTVRSADRVLHDGTESLTADGTVTDTITIAGERWLLVQLAASGGTADVEGVERAVRITARWE